MFYFILFYFLFVKCNILYYEILAKQTFFLVFLHNLQHLSNKRLGFFFNTFSNLDILVKINDWLYWSILSCTGLYWSVLVSVGLYWSVLMCTGLYWSIPVCTSLYWSLHSLHTSWSGLILQSWTISSPINQRFWHIWGGSTFHLWDHQWELSETHWPIDIGPVRNISWWPTGPLLNIHKGSAFSWRREGYRRTHKHSYCRNTALQNKHGKYQPRPLPRLKISLQ